MNTLVIYDTTGFIIQQSTGDTREPIGIPFMYVCIPQGKSLVKIDTSKQPHVPFYIDVPKTETQDIKQQMTAMQEMMAQMNQDFMSMMDLFFTLNPGLI